MKAVWILAVLFLAFCAAGTDKPILKVGILTDTHVGSHYTKDATHIAGAFRLFRNQGVDAIVNLGDVADRHDERLYCLYRAEEEKAFPPGTSRPRRYFVFAWHDAFSWRGHPRNAAMKDQPDAYRDVKAALGAENSPIDRIDLNGIPLVFFYQWLDWDSVDYDAILSRAEREHPGKPVLVFDHTPVLNTVSQTHRGENGDACGRRRTILNRHPRVVHFSGHKHGTLRDERNIWQGTFTAVNAGCMQVWGRDPVKHERGALVAELYDDRLVLRRFDTRDGTEIGSTRPWVVPLPFDPKTAPYADARRAATDIPADFPADAELLVRQTGDVVRLSFPEAGDPTNRAACYRLEIGRTGVDGTLETFYRCEIEGDYWMRADERTGHAMCYVPSACFRPDSTYVFRLFPCGFFGAVGRSLERGFRMPKSNGGYSLVWEDKTPMDGMCPFTDGVTDRRYEQRDGYYHSDKRLVGRFLLPEAVVAGERGTKYRIVADIRVKTRPGEVYMTAVAGAADPDYQAMTRRFRLEGGTGTLTRVVYEFVHDGMTPQYCLYTFLDGQGASDCRFESVRVFRLSEGSFALGKDPKQE